MVQLHKRFTDEQIRESGGFGCKAAAKLNQRSAGQIIVIFVDVQRILPKNIETEFAQIVRN
ncbi:MAG: hypothetical protein A4E71_01635 [Smithella sp. PtaU1.Bin162]|nr:MAG: hypothetical protein A4E71_01635 [Smithella sp. PtaU1.Bin162]